MSVIMPLFLKIKTHEISETYHYCHTIKDLAHAVYTLTCSLEPAKAVIQQDHFTSDDCMERNDFTLITVFS